MSENGEDFKHGKTHIHNKDFTSQFSIKIKVEEAW
jgi:hypothetical protein